MKLSVFWQRQTRQGKPRLYGLVFALFFLLSPLFATSHAQIQPKVAVTLAGGVARGFAFLGALEVLVKEGVPVNRIVGTSAGAMVAGLYASGYSFQTLERIFAQLQANQGDLVRVLFPPVQGLLDIGGFEVMYRTLVEGQKLEQTSPALAVMATELRPAPPRALVTGDIAAAIRASISLPVVFPVVQIDGVYYADGGLREPFPVGVARALGNDIVIGIRGQPDPTASPDNLFGALSFVIGALTLPLEQTQPDAWIRAKTFDALYFDFSRVPELMQRGREAASAELPQILAMLKQKGVILNPKGDPHENNPINQNWQARLERGLLLARNRPRPFTVAPAIELAPSAFEWNTRPAQASQFSSLGVGADFSGGVLGNFSFGLGYVERLNDNADNIFLRTSFDAPPFRVYAILDPARRPDDAPWELGLEYRAGNIWNPPFMARVSADALALGIAGQGQVELGGTQISGGLEWRFGYAPSLRLQATVGIETSIKPWFIRARGLLGLATGGAQGFSLGYHSFLRGYPANFLVSKQAIVSNLEFGFRFELPNVAGIFSAAPEFRLFYDVGWGLDVTAGSSQFLWSAGLGLNIPGAWFGFLPFGVGMDFAFSPVGVRLVAYTILPFK